MISFLPVLENEPGTYVFFAFAVTALIQLLFVLLIYGRMAFFKQAVDKAPFRGGVSVIIAARNEAQNLYANLPAILEQDFPEFEVIVVNHQSMDESQYILDAYKQQYPHLKTIEVQRSEHLKFGKKLPLTIGIKGAKYEHLLFTDADCNPAGRKWLSSMAGKFDETKEIVVGYGPYKKKKGLLNKFIRFDTAWIGLNYFSFARSGMPYMGIGRNMAYTKSVFNSVNGFKSHYSLSSGDDDLFIQEAARKGNYTININPESYCYSDAADTWKGWYKQKSRHYTTAEKYKVFKKLMLGIYPLSLLLMLLSFVILLFNANFIWLTLASFIFVLAFKWIIIGLAFKRLQENAFIRWLPLWDIVYVVWTTIMYYSADRTDNKRW